MSVVGPDVLDPWRLGIESATREETLGQVMEHPKRRQISLENGDKKRSTISYLAALFAVVHMRAEGGHE